jgi:hypothetical protein
MGFDRKRDGSKMDQVIALLEEIASGTTASLALGQESIEISREIQDAWRRAEERTKPQETAAFNQTAFSQSVPGKTVESTYGNSLPALSPPDGWEFTGEFRHPKENEWFYSAQFNPLQSSFPDTRLILRKIRRWVLEEVAGPLTVPESEYVVIRRRRDCRVLRAFWARIKEQPKD